MTRVVRRLIFILLVGLGSSAWLFDNWLDKPGPLKTPQTIILSPGLSVQGITDLLLSTGAIDRAVPFRLAVALRSGDNLLKAGEYKIAPGSSPKTIIDELVSGKTVIHKITVPEGLTIAQIYELIESAPALSGTIDIKIEEGFLLPNTYHYYRNHSRNEMLRRMERLMKTTLETLWSNRSQDLPYSRPVDALILASIIEKETGMPDERRRVAAVFINRLLLGMPLQSDPTVEYGITGGKHPLGRPLNRTELRDKSSLYNTYRHSGLPPGPITNPGKASLLAALSPLKTDELYFVANGRGGHNFAKTLDEHNKNVARWRKLLKQDLDCGAC